MKQGDTQMVGPVGDGNNSTTQGVVMTTQFELTIDNGLEVIGEGIAGDIKVPYPCVITEVGILADQLGCLILDIWKDTFANFPPTIADSIVAAAWPSVCSDTKYVDSTLTGWTTVLAAGDVLRFNVITCELIQKAVVTLKTRKA